MLRYTARYLLSRTLRTILSKYLDDVDVDNFEVPTFGGDDNAFMDDGVDGSKADAAAADSSEHIKDGSTAAADESGWGISLSNVRLREGVTLMELPGKRTVVTVKRKRRRTTVRRRAQTGLELEPPIQKRKDIGTEPIILDDQKTSSYQYVDTTAMLAATDSPQRPRNPLPSAAAPGTPTSATVPVDRMEGVLLSPTPSTQDEFQSNDGDLDDESDGEIIRYGVLSSASAASGKMTPPLSISPPTPPGRSSWACFVRGRHSSTASGVVTGNGARTAALAPVPAAGIDYPIDRDDDIQVPDSSAHDTGHADKNDDIQCPVTNDYNSGLIDYRQEYSSAVADRKENGGSETNLQTDPLSEEADSAQNDDNEDTDEDFEHYEEEISVEENLELKVGAGGRIGTLQIKIVGKDYHITVEDADLVLEIVPKTLNDNVATADDNESAHDGDLSTSEADTTNVPASMNQSVEPSSTEDKVMENSRLARYLAAIPNLYLRDCRAKVVTRFNHSMTAETEEAEQCDKSEQENSSTTTYVLGIDFLSVTGGEDFLAHARSSVDGSHHSGAQSQQPFFRESVGDAKHNEFLRKRVRTGKGPGAGIYFQVFPPLKERKMQPHYFSGRPEPHPVHSFSKVGSKWAIRAYAKATNMCVLRLSGLDVHARILLKNSKENDASTDEFAQDTTPTEDYFYFDYDADLVVYGIDYPGVANSNSQIDTEERNPETDDKIETIQIRSNFHRIARGLRRTCCSEGHLPSEDCSKCWSQIDPNSPCLEKESFENEIDSCMPLPGLVLYFSISDPLELNIERSGLEQLHLLKEMFSTSSESSDSRTKNPSRRDQSGEVAESRSSKADSAVPRSVDSQAAVLGNAEFPAFMKPESVHCVGVHVANFCLRLHAMKSSDDDREDGLSFCYWEMKLAALTVDSQNLNAKELSFKDMRVSIGQVLLYELKGVCRKRTLSMGLDPSFESEDQHPIASTDTLCTAADILDVSSSYESLALLHRQGNAVHLRMVNVPSSAEFHLSDNLPLSRSCIDVKIGIVDADFPPAMYSNIMAAKNQALWTLFRGTRGENDEPTNPENTKEPNSSSCSEYSIRLDGGKFNMRPRIKCSFPSTTLSGHSTSNEGFSIESILHRVKIEYGQRSKMRPQTKPSISMWQLAQLTEASRLQILLYLDDLAPFEKALALKRTGKHMFMRCHAISQRISQFKQPLPTSATSKGRTISKESTKDNRRHKGQRTKFKMSSSSSGNGGRRSSKQQLVTRLMALDEDDLERLLENYKVFPRERVS